MWMMIMIMIVMLMVMVMMMMVLMIIIMMAMMMRLIKMMKRKVTIIFGFFKADPARALTRTDSVFLFLSKRVVHLDIYLYDMAQKKTKKIRAEKYISTVK